MGYRRTDRSLSHGCNRLQSFEQTGKIDTGLFGKLMLVLDVDQATVNGLLQKDLADWLEWANEPIEPHLVVRLMPAVYSQADLPDEVRSVEDAESYASAFAKGHRLRSVSSCPAGCPPISPPTAPSSIASEAIPGGEPNQPYTKIGEGGA